MIITPALITVLIGKWILGLQKYPVIISFQFFLSNLYPKGIEPNKNPDCFFQKRRHKQSIKICFPNEITDQK